MKIQLAQLNKLIVATLLLFAAGCALGASVSTPVPTLTPGVTPTASFTPISTPTPSVAPTASFTPVPTLTPNPTSAPSPTVEATVTTASGKFNANFPLHINCIADIAVDAQNIYWSSCGTQTSDYRVGAIQTMPKSGGQVRSLAAKWSSPGKLIVGDESVFWLDGKWMTETTLMRVSKDGGPAHAMVTDPNQITSLAVDEDHVYWTTCSWSHDAPFGAVMRMPKSGGSPEVLIPDAGCPGSLALDDTTIYWVDDGLQALDKSGGTPVTLLRVDDDMRRTLSLSLKSEWSRVYVREIIKLDATYIYFTAFTDNTGMGSCLDNHTRILRMPKATSYSTLRVEMLEFLAWMWERVVEFSVDDTSMYLVGRCDDRPEILRVFDSGKYVIVNLEEDERGDPSAYVSKFAVDETSIYWWSGEGLLHKVSKQTDIQE